MAKYVIVFLEDMLKKKKNTGLQGSTLSALLTQVNKAFITMQEGMFLLHHNKCFVKRL